MLKTGIAQIKDYIKQLDSRQQYRLIPQLLEDERTSVRNIGKQLQNKLKRETQEFERINRMKEMEKGLRRKGFSLIAGIDEAGRGPLAGPVAAAAVVLPDGFCVPGVNDSKKLSPQRREELYQRIVEESLDYGVGMVDNIEIDRINILNATYRAAGIAVEKLKKYPDCLLLDAIRLPGYSCYQKSVIKGDQKCLSIAAASIVAKVTRDRYMLKLHQCYPQYNFEQNKGYGTREHIKAIMEHGPSPVHRNTFIQNIRR